MCATVTLANIHQETNEILFFFKEETATGEKDV